MAGRRERARGLELVGKRKGAGLDDRQRTRVCARNGRDGRGERGRIGQADDDGSHRAGERAGIRRHLDAGPRERPPPRRIDVVTDDAPASGEEVARKRAPHDAEADDADRAFFPRRAHEPPV